MRICEQLLLFKDARESSISGDGQLTTFLNSPLSGITVCEMFTCVGIIIFVLLYKHSISFPPQSNYYLFNSGNKNTDIIFKYANFYVNFLW